ncbi:hypothetical protein ACVWZA_000646 [Sphingomonas sp. UYAg733]
MLAYPLNSWRPEISLIDVAVGPFALTARLEIERAPLTSAFFHRSLPLEDSLIHVRWSGEGCWIPMGDAHQNLPWENHGLAPAPGQFLFYPGGISETEILLAYGEVRFASKFGPLVGNHFMTVIRGNEHLAEIGRRALWEGALPIRFSLHS